MKNKTDNFCNHDDHEEWSRRSFLKALGFLGAGSLTLENSSLLYAKDSKLTNAIQNAESDNILIIIRLFGGNDGLNTIVPLNQYDLYASARSSLKINESDLWKLSDDYGMPNYTSGFENLWEEGKMKVVHSVGYDDHNLSHFKGTQIWSSGQVDNSGDITGWLGRYYEDLYPDYNATPPSMPTAIQIGTSKNVTFDGLDAKYSFSVSNLERLEAITNSGLVYGINELPDCTHGDKLKFMRSITNSTYGYADVIYDSFNQSTDYTSGDGYPDDDFSKSLNIISRLIKGNLGTKVYMLTLDGFDTHAAQKATHENLLTTLSNAVDAFYKDLGDAGYGDKVLAMTVSEFGRRIDENGSGGTDHGTSSPILFFGEGLNGNGFVGQHASLERENLNGNYLKHHTDFRSVYATVLKEWLCVDATIVDNTILQNTYDSVDLGFSCRSLSAKDLNIRNLTVTVSIENGTSYIILQNFTTKHIVIKLYSMNGEEIGVVSNDFFQEGTFRIDVKNSINKKISAGPYIFRIVTNDDTKTVGKVIPII